jgi:uncharacterized protein YdeI (YjbR/CyaY-like superfamily)
MKATFFPSAAKFRAWLARHHATAKELQVGFYKKSAGQAGLTYKEAVDEALCFGWIDGVMHKIDAERYRLRFTPRKPGSNWSNVNVANVARLTAARRMRAAGLAAFAARTAKKTGIYSFEAKAPAVFGVTDEKTFRANKPAWTFFQAQAPWWRRKVTWWVVHAKQDATRARRLATLIAACAAGRRI